MALVTRLTRLFQADFHAVLDRIEEPDLQLRQAVREMQLALDQDRQRLALLEHETAQLQETGAALEQAMRAYDEELDICLAAKKDDLARDLLRRKLGDEKRLASTRQQAQTIELQCGRLQKQVEEQAQQLVSMKQKLELLVSDNNGQGSNLHHAGDSIRNEEVEIALLREKQRRVKA